MRKQLYRLATLAVLSSLMLGACGPRPTPPSTSTARPTATSEPSPTPPPYTPPPRGDVSPVVIQRTPERGAEMSPDGVIELVFDRAMDKSSVEEALQVSPGVSGEIDWVDERTLRFKPSRDLERDREYRVTIGSKAKTADGEQLEDSYRFRFRTTGFLEVSQVIPAPDAQDVEANSTITVIFNRPVVPLTAVSDPARQDLPQPLTFEPPIEGQGEWINTSIYAFTPEEAMAGGTTYTARVEAGLEDTTGGVLEEAYEWTFTTQPPKVTWVSPKEGAELVSVEPTVRVEFNMPVDPASAGQAFTLSGDGEVVDGDFEVVTNTLVFTPTEQLAFDTTYTAQVDEGVLSVGGGEGMRAAYRWSFTTVPLPRIVSTSPRDGQQDVDPHHPFEIIFNAPIDPSTVMPNLELRPEPVEGMSPPLSPTQVHTYFHENRFVLRFNSQPSTDYEVRIGPDIADPYGNTTGQEMTVHYRTAPLDPLVQLDIPGRLGTYNADQPAQVFVGHLNIDQINLRLYRLDLKQYFSAYENWWEYQVPQDSLREWSVSLDAPLNEKEHTLVDLAEGGGRLEPGLYMLEVTAPGVDFEPWMHRRLLSFSRYNLTIKRSEGELWAWATELATGQPVSDLPLKAHYPSAGSGHRADAEPVGPMPTDQDGLAHFEFDPDAGHMLHVVSEDPFVLGGVGWEWEQGISPWDFGLRGGTSEWKYRAYVTTDRPIYRAGQTVHFRGVLRSEDDVSYTMTGFEEVQVLIYDPEGEEVFNDGLALDEFGAFHGELTLDEGAALGEYRIVIKLDRVFTRATFTVAAYRPPEFEVNVTLEKKELVSGQATQADVDVSYFFGGGVADAEVEWRVLSAPYRFEPQQFGRYDFTDDDDPWVCRWCWWREPPRPEPILEGTGTTDAEGHLSINIPTKVMTGGQKLTVEATVYGRDGQAISGRSDFIVHQGDFYVGLAPQQRVGRAGEEMGVDVVTVDWDGKRVPDQELDVEVYRREWVNTFVENEHGGGRWEWETKDTLVHTDTLATDENAKGTITFTPEQGGSYRIVAQARDTQYAIRTSTWVWVSGAEDVAWRRQNDDQFDLISDKSSYVPGETAEILTPSPFQGEQWAWITVERAGVLKTEVRKLESNSDIYRLPIEARYAPNVYVSVVIVKGPDANDPVATHKVGYLPLTVEPVEQTLDISVTPSAERAGPGDTVSFDIEARDASGEPVQTSFSVDLVDKAVLSLKPRKEDDTIVEAFYGRRGLDVSTASGLILSVNRVLMKQMEELDQIAMWGMGMGGGGGAAPEAMEAPAMAPADERAKSEEGVPPGVELREKFKDTAFWDASVVTDRSGQASVEIELPDNLTTWVFRAVGVTKETKVGQETAELMTTKPLLVRPATPRFFVVDDRAQLAALVSNTTDEPLDTTVTLHTTGLTLDGIRNTQHAVTVTIPARGEEKVTWWVRVEDVPYVDVRMSAVSDQYSDAARPRLTTGPDGTLVVHRYTAPEIVGTGGQLVGEDSRTEAIALPPKYDDRKGELSVRLDPSLAAGMADGLDYLEHYPYECTEQIVSRFLPNVLTYRALQDLGLSRPELEEKLPGLVSEALNKLYERQNSDGGWGWWPDGESRAHLTAYVVFAMEKAREADFEVRESVIERGLGYLRGELVTAREFESYREANRQAFILYVMAESERGREGEGETGRQGDGEIETYVDDLFESRDKLSHYGRAFLALAMGLVNEDDNRIDTLLSDLRNDAIISATGAHWEEENYGYWAMNTDTRSTAVILDALARLDPENELIPNVVRWLMVARRDGIWETTYETAWALIALTDSMKVTGELQGEYDYAVWLNDEMLEGGHVTPETVEGRRPEPVEGSIKLQVEVAKLLADTSNDLTIGRSAGEGRLYYTAHLKVYLPVEEIEPLSRGVIVSRHYSDPECTEGLECPEVETVEVGGVVRVRLTIVAPHDLYYMVVEDPLPAGAEAIDPSLATTSLVAQPPTLLRGAEGERGFYPVVTLYLGRTGLSASHRTNRRWWWHWYNRSEMRDDKVVLFADYLPAGTYEYTYAFRATRPGEYHVIPTNAREFYFPEVFGRGAGRMLTIQAED